MLLSLAVPVLKAQTPSPTLGARLSMELTFPSGGYDYYKTGAGMTAGVSAKFPLEHKFFFEPSLLFSYTGLSSKYLVELDGDYYYQNSANLYTLRLPLEFGYDFRLSDESVMSVATGPWLNLNLCNSQSISPNFGAPVPEPERKVARQYYVGVTTGVAFTPLAKFGNRDKKIRVYRNTVALSLGYNF